MGKLYRICLNEKLYPDVIEVLEAISKPLRGKFIAESIRYYCMSIENEIKNKSKKMKEETNHKTEIKLAEEENKDFDTLESIEKEEKELSQEEFNNRMRIIATVKKTLGGV